MDEATGATISSDVSGSSPAPGVSYEGAPLSSQGVDGATPAQGGDSSPESVFVVPENDLDLDGMRNVGAYKQNLINVRGAYRDLNSRYQEQANQYQQLQEQAQRWQDLGGVDTAAVAVDLIQKLVQPMVDQNGYPITDPQTGLPFTDTKDFVSSVAQSNWNTAVNMTEHLLSLPTNRGGTILDAIITDYLGLNPQLMDVYRQIQSPQDAARMGAYNVTPEEMADLNYLSGTPNEFLETYKNMNEAERNAVMDANLSDATRLQMLRTAQRDQQIKAFYDQQQQQLASQQQAEQAHYEAQVSQAADNAVVSLWNSHAGVLEQQLQKVQWTSDQGTNDFLNNCILSGIGEVAMTDPVCGPLIAQARDLARESIIRQAYGNKWEANQARVRAQDAAGRAAVYAGKIMNRMVEGLNAWRAGVAQQPETEGQGRPVITGNGQQGTGGRWQPTPGTRMLSPEYFDQLLASRR